MTMFFCYECVRKSSWRRHFKSISYQKIQNNDAVSSVAVI